MQVTGKQLVALLAMALVLSALPSAPRRAAPTVLIPLLVPIPATPCAGHPVLLPNDDSAGLAQLAILFAIVATPSAWATIPPC